MAGGETPSARSDNLSVTMLEPHVFIVFGATGDLMQRKLLPALYDLYTRHPAVKGSAIVGAGRTDLTDEAFRERTREVLIQRGIPLAEASAWCTERIYYVTLGKQEPADFDRLRAGVEAVEEAHELPGNRVLYLALPPGTFEDTIERVREAGLSDPTRGWSRLVVEKPFGQDLATARSLNALVHRAFHEDQIYRIDHYLGKETVQNLLVFRLGNAIFESLWNREHVERVDLLVAEDLGLGTRAGYFDHTGILRDMVQNHLTQLLTLVAMEVPATASAEAIRHEKIKVLQSVQPLSLDAAVFGQYTRGKLDSQTLPGYREEDGVDSGSNTPTYVAARLHINNWRWQGVPFVLQSGKRMPRRLTRIAVTFRRPPVMLFAADNRCQLTPNVLHITLQPDEGFSLSFEVKKPGQGFAVQTQRLRFLYEGAFGLLPEAYRTLLEDILRGDQTLFVHAEEVETSWELYAPLLDDSGPVHFYAAGTWGPPEAGRILKDPPLHIHEL
jgi:glucose-6-phosphate 1-dehydrogenase